jgi:hypothetical protein
LGLPELELDRTGSFGIGRTGARKIRKMEVSTNHLELCFRENHMEYMELTEETAGSLATLVELNKEDSLMNK